MMITPEQIKTARVVLLRWTQERMAKMAGLTKNTISNLESGEMSPRPATLAAIRSVCEKAGLEFTSDGVIRIADSVRKIKGIHACDEFFDDMLHTVMEKGGDIVSVFDSQKLLAGACHIASSSMERLNRLGSQANIRCIVSEPFSDASILPFKFRMVSKPQIGPVSYFVYGRKHAVVQDEGNGTFSFLIYTSACLSEAYRKHFHILWDSAFTMPHQAAKAEHRARI
jgi:transcriptional regulator with XRE-family HTH domain